MFQFKFSVFGVVKGSDDILINSVTWNNVIDWVILIWCSLVNLKRSVVRNKWFSIDATIGLKKCPIWRKFWYAFFCDGEFDAEIALSICHISKGSSDFWILSEISDFVACWEIINWHWNWIIHEVEVMLQFEFSVFGVIE